MTREQRLQYFKSGLTNEIGEQKQLGGQSCSVIDSSVKLIHKDLGFEIKSNGSKSQLKNLKFAMTVFELYLDEFYK
jgi:protein subunit release factor A